VTVTLGTWTHILNRYSNKEISMKSELGSHLLAIVIGVAAYWIASALNDAFPTFLLFHKVLIDSRIIFLPLLLILAVASFKLLTIGIKKL
jgi:hypothetical protein